MPTFQTPDYLQFAEQMPKEGPFAAATEGLAQGVETGEDIVTKQAQAQVAQMQAKALPKEIEQNQQIRAQQITKSGQDIQMGAEDLAAHPKDIQQKQEKSALDIQKEQGDISDADMLRAALPKEIANKLTTEHLDIISKGIANKADSYKTNELLQSTYDKKLGEILHQDVSNRQAALDNLNEWGRSMGMDMRTNPKQWNLSTIRTAVDNYNRYDGKAAADFAEKAALKAIDGRWALARVDAQTRQKLLSGGATAEAKANVKDWHDYKNDLQNASSYADNSLAKIDRMEDAMRQNSNLFGTTGFGTVGKGTIEDITGNPVIRQVKNDQAGLVMDFQQQMKGANRASKSLIEQAEKIKPNLLKDPLQTSFINLEKVRAISTAHIMQLEFANKMEQMGVANKGEVDQAWRDFQTSVSPQMNKLIEKGQNGAQLLTQYEKWFQQHSDKLPNSFQHIYAMGKYANAPVQPKSIVPTYSGTTLGNLYGSSY